MAKMTTLIMLFFMCALLWSHIPAGTVAADLDPCQDSDLQISTAPTGKVVGGQQEYLVTVENKCSCPVSGVVLSCPDGLSSTEPVNRTMIHVVGDQGILCLVYNGWPIDKGSQITFTYAWKGTLGFTMYNFKPKC